MGGVGFVLASGAAEVEVVGAAFEEADGGEGLWGREVDRALWG